MCGLFKSRDPMTYAAETRPTRLYGHAASVWLEAAYWTTLEEIAGHEGVPLAQFCAILHDEMAQQGDRVGNFASMLRVTCLHYLRHHETYLAEIAARHTLPEKIAA